MLVVADVCANPRFPIGVFDSRESNPRDCPSLFRLWNLSLQQAASIYRGLRRNGYYCLIGVRPEGRPDNRRRFDPPRIENHRRLWLLPKHWPFPNLDRMRMKNRG